MELAVKKQYPVTHGAHRRSLSRFFVALANIWLKAGIYIIIIAVVNHHALYPHVDKLA